MKQLVNIVIVLAAVVLLFGDQLGITTVIPTAPFEVDKFSVVIVEETEERINLPRSQLTAMRSIKWLKYVEEKEGQWRKIDKDADVTGDEQWVQDALTVERDSLPWLLIATPDGGTSEPMPADLDAFLEVLKSHGE